MNLNHLKLLVMIALLTACGQNNYSESELDGVELQGAANATLDDIKSTGLWACISNPISCLTSKNQGKKTVGLWASYENDERGKARAICNPVCEEDQSFIGENHDNTSGTVMGMEVPKNWTIPTQAVYAYGAVGRALGVIESPNATKAEVSIQKAVSAKSSGSYRERLTDGVIEFAVATINPTTKLKLKVLFYFSEAGELISIINNQEQKFNERTQIQSSELHVLD